MWEISNVFDSNKSKLSDQEIGEMSRLKKEIKTWKLTKDNLNFSPEELQQIVKVFEENRDEYMKRASDTSKASIWNLFDTIIWFLKDPSSYKAPEKASKKPKTAAAPSVDPQTSEVPTNGVLPSKLERQAAAGGAQTPEPKKWMKVVMEWSTEPKWKKEKTPATGKWWEISISSPEEAEKMIAELAAKWELLKPVDQVSSKHNKVQPQRHTVDTTPQAWVQAPQQAQTPIQAPVYWQGPEKWVIPSSVERASWAPTPQNIPQNIPPVQERTLSDAPVQAPQSVPQQTPSKAPAWNSLYEQATREVTLDHNAREKFKTDLSKVIETTLDRVKWFPITNMVYPPEMTAFAQKNRIMLPEHIGFDAQSQQLVLGGRYDMNVDFNAKNTGHKKISVLGLFNIEFDGKKAKWKSYQDTRVTDITFNWSRFVITGEVNGKRESRTIDKRDFTQIMANCVAYNGAEHQSKDLRMQLTRMK